MKIYYKNIDSIICETNFLSIRDSLYQLAHFNSNLLIFNVISKINKTNEY